MIRRVVGCAIAGAIAVGMLLGPSAAAPALAQPVAAPTVHNVSVSITDQGFDPPILQVSPGTTVVWTNRGQRVHDVTSTTGLFQSDPLSPGDQFLYTFAAGGNYAYRSASDPGTTAQIVTAGQPGGASAPEATPPTSGPSSSGTQPRVASPARPTAKHSTGISGTVIAVLVGTTAVILAGALLARFGARARRREVAPRARHRRTHAR